MPPDFYYSYEFERAKREVIELFLEPESESISPVGMLLGGQPASGKTKLIRFIRNNYAERFTIINGDEFREYHPRYEEIKKLHGLDAPTYTQKFSNAMVEAVKEECIRRRYNIIIEGTMRNPAVIENTAKELKKAGYRCEGHVLAIHCDDSTLGVFQRYEWDWKKTGSGRFSNLDIHDEAYRQIPVNLNTALQHGWLDRIVLYCRDNQQALRSFFSTDREEREKVDFISEFDKARKPVYSKEYYYQRWLEIQEMARLRGENHAPYLLQIQQFIDQYKT